MADAWEEETLKYHEKTDSSEISAGIHYESVDW